MDPSADDQLEAIRARKLAELQEQIRRRQAAFAGPVDLTDSTF